MALGAVTSLGVGSNFELQDMLEKFRTNDETTVRMKEATATKIDKQLEEYEVLTNQVFTMKSSARELSLQSNYLEKEISVSDEEVASATVQSGATAESHAIEVVSLAKKNTFLSGGVEERDTSIYEPVVEEQFTGNDDTDTATPLTAPPSTLSLNYNAEDGTQKTFAVDLLEMTLDDMVEAINNHGENQTEGGEPQVVAETFEDADGKFGVRLTYPTPTQTFSFSVGEDSDPIEVEVAKGTTLTELAGLINDADSNSGVTASIIDTGVGDTPFKLALTSKTAGEEGRITIHSQLGGFALTEDQGADGESLNAEVKVDGITYQRQKNDGITDIIGGVTLNLKDTGTSSLDITTDTEFIKTEVTGLVSTFSEIIAEIEKSTTEDEESGEEGVLTSTPVSIGLSNEIRELLGTFVETGSVSEGFYDEEKREYVITKPSVKSVFDIGISFNRDGSISLDEKVLNAAIENGPDDLLKLFAGDPERGVKGLGDILNDGLRDLTSNTSGLLGSEKSKAEAQAKRISVDIEATTERLDKKYDIMARRFVELDKFIGLINSQSAYLTSVFDSFSSSKE